MSPSSSFFKSVPVAANSTNVAIHGTKIGGFIPTAAGTWTFTLRKEGVPDIVLPNITVPAGNVGLLVHMPIYVGVAGRATVTTSGGGAGILLVA